MAVLSPTGPDMAHRTPRAAEIESLNIAPLPRDFGSIGRPSDHTLRNGAANMRRDRGNLDQARL